jgi:hypothetical protein
MTSPPTTPPAAKPDFFTDQNDNRDFNALNPPDFIQGSWLNTKGGDDNVTLPSAANEAKWGFSSSVPLTLGTGTDTVTIPSNPGDYTINGGGGHDTVKFAGRPTDYTIDDSDPTLTLVTDQQGHTTKLSAEIQHMEFDSLGDNIVSDDKLGNNLYLWLAALSADAYNPNPPGSIPLVKDGWATDAGDGTRPAYDGN